MAFRAIPQRWGGALVLAIGMACVAGVFLSILSLATGLMDTIAATGRPDRVMILSQNARTEFESGINRQTIQQIGALPQVARDAQGAPVLSPEIFTSVTLSKKSDGLDEFVTVRGVGQQAGKLRPELKVVDGRGFAPGTHEVIVGAGAHAQFQGTDIGAQLALPGGNWRIVGIFKTGDARESEVIADNEALMSALGKQQFSDATVRLSSPAALAPFRETLAESVTPPLIAESESDYSNRLAGPLYDFLRLVAWLVGAIMGVGAGFVALSVTYATVSARAGEFATLRAMGFSMAALVTSLLLEVTVLSLSGVVAATILAIILFSGQSSTMEGLVFPLSIAPSSVMVVAAGTWLFGMAGALGPVIHLTRQNLPQVLATVASTS